MTRAPQDEIAGGKQGIMWQQLQTLAAMVESLLYRVTQLEVRVAALEQELAKRWQQ